MSPMRCAAVGPKWGRADRRNLCLFSRRSEHRLGYHAFHAELIGRGNGRSTILFATSEAMGRRLGSKGGLAERVLPYAPVSARRKKTCGCGYSAVHCRATLDKREDARVDVD